VGDDPDVFDSEVLQEPDDVGAEGSPALAIEVMTAPESARVESDAGVVLRKERHLLPPD